MQDTDSAGGGGAASSAAGKMNVDLPLPSQAQVLLSVRLDKMNADLCLPSQTQVLLSEIVLTRGI